MWVFQEIGQWDLASSELLSGLRIIFISATFYSAEMKHKRKMVLYKYVKKVNPFSGRFFSNVAVIKSCPGFDLISYFKNLLIAVFEYSFC